jgi:hypothetical protein
MKICKRIHIWCLSWCLTFKLQTAHGKGKGGTILTKQNITTTMRKDQEW